MTTALEGGEGSVSRLGPSLPPGKTRYPLYRRLGELQGWSGQVRKISPPPGFDPRTVQPVASRYTHYATRPTIVTCRCHIFFSSIILLTSSGNFWIVPTLHSVSDIYKLSSSMSCNFPNHSIIPSCTALNFIPFTSAPNKSVCSLRYCTKFHTHARYKL
jgi:hypothetical protein